MARKFFNQKVKKSRKGFDSKFYVLMGFIGFGAIVGVIILLVILMPQINNNKKLKAATIEIRDNNAIELYGDIPDKTLFFGELANVKEEDIIADFKNVKTNQLGTYDVTFKIFGKTFKAKLKVVDTIVPSLEVKNHTINVGDKYSASDFVKKCSDNSKKDCNIEFYKLSLTQDGNNINYGSFEKEGTYKVQIVASDESGNATTPQEATLTIGKSSEKPQICKYGNGDYDTEKYILAVNVTDNNCALDLNLYQSDDIVAPAREMIKAEEEKLKKEFEKININAEVITINSSIGPVLNKTGNGIVGYTIFMEVLSTNKSGENEVIETYYLDTNGKRSFELNKFLK